MDSYERRLNRFFDEMIDQQEASVLKALNDPSKRALLLTKAADENSIIDHGLFTLSTTNIDSTLREIYMEGVSQAVKSDYGGVPSEEVVNAAVSEHMATVNEANLTTKQKIALALLALYTIDFGDEDEDNDDTKIARRVAMASVLVKTIFNKLRTYRKNMAVDASVYGLYNQGVYDSASSSTIGKGIYKEWVSLHDERVRHAHRELDGKKQLLGMPFWVEGRSIRFPRDPLAPIDLTINCRCVLKLSWKR